MTIPAARLQALHQQIQQGQALAALPELERLRKKEPRNSTVLALQGEALRRLGRRLQAGQMFRRAAELSGNKVYWTAAGAQLADALDFDAALECLQHALKDNPDDTAILDTLIHTLIKAGRQAQGDEIARRQLILSNDPSQLNKAAQLLMRPGSLSEDNYAECAAAYRRVDELAPDDPKFLGPALTTARYVCDWNWCESLQQRILKCYAQGDFAAPGEAAFWNLSWCDDEAINLQVTRVQLQSRRGDLTITPLELKALAVENRRLRVGYLSSDFCDHATLHLMAGVFEHHDRSRFEFFAYDYSVADGSDFRKRFLAAIEHHVPVNGLDDAQVAQRIAADQLDLLLDLKLYTKDQRPNIIAYRPAPLIAAFLGFPGSAATSAVDYVISDRFVTPDSSAPFYDEKFCRLPHSYQCNDRKRLTAVQATTRSAHGLPEEAIVFADFNQAYKLDRRSFRLWMRILKGVPGSVLWLLRQSAGACEALLRHAQAEGIEPSRIIFAPPLHAYFHRARLPLADAVLDTLVYNGHTSSADALWAGVPVITARGRHFASRVSESLLNAINLPELVGIDADAMAMIAIRIGTDTPYRLELRQRLVDHRLTTPLFDTARFTRDFETALQMMVDRKRSGLPPDHLDVPDAGPVATGPADLSTVIERMAASVANIPAIASGSRRPVWVHVGCGDGRLLAASAARGFGALGLEADAQAAEQLRQRGLRVMTCQQLAQDFLSIDFSGAAAPDVLSLQNFETQFPDPRASLAKASATLAPGTTLLLNLTGESGIGALSSLLIEHGFEVIGPILTPGDTARVDLHAVRRTG